MENNHSLDSRNRVAREAAILLYTLQEKEYKQAKSKAAQTLGMRILPSNAEVAEELDKIAEEKEGQSRHERLSQMREEAFQIMSVLKAFHPRLVGSVWRGTTHRNSDIDVIVFSSDHEAVLDSLVKGSFKVVRSEWSSVTKRGRRESSFHIHLVLPSGNEAEVVVRSLEKMSFLWKCEIYGDVATGLSCSQLQRVLKENPLQRFVSK
ncbi:MAG: nucleotidyltransferase domain-containing protein [Candidatus Bathyarchaeota archaeon]|nr:MAG: nucleotidyltransferase domain-containing protein [Candidatus Bathyarchaeota archaeon]